MRELRQSTQVIVTIGTAVAVGDGFTPVTTLSLASADEAELIKANTTTTTDISGATFAAITGADGTYGLTLTTSHTDTLGALRVMINDDSLILPLWCDFMVLTAAEWDRKYTAAGPGLTGIVTYGTAQAGGNTSIQLASATSFADDLIIGATVLITGGTGVGQSRIITDWVSSTDTATVDTWTTNPDSSSTYVVFSTPPASATLLPDVNVAQVSTDATAADTLELFAEALDQATGQLDSGSLAAGTITAASVASAALPSAKFDAADPVPANVQEINDVTVNGDGAGTPWGP